MVWNPTCNISEVHLDFLFSHVRGKSHMQESPSQLKGQDVSQDFKGRTWVKLERCQNENVKIRQRMEVIPKKNWAATFSCNSNSRLEQLACIWTTSIKGVLEFAGVKCRRPFQPRESSRHFKTMILRPKLITIKWEYLDVQCWHPYFLKFPRSFQSATRLGTSCTDYTLELPGSFDGVPMPDSPLTNLHRIFVNKAPE